MDLKNYIEEMNAKIEILEKNEQELENNLEE